MASSPPRDEDGWLRAAFGALVPGPRVVLGIGHDAAVVRHDGRDVVLKTDAVVDGVDFRLAECGPALAARKAVAVAVSDLAAAGATPRALLVSAILPRTISWETFRALSEGLVAAALEVGADLVGGDTTVADAPLSLSVFATGDLMGPAPVSRSGARAGQRLSVTGALGGSILGRHLRVRPRLDASRALVARGIPSAMMDLSDGLSRDLPRLCRASGVGALVDEAALPVHADVARLPADGRSPAEHALDDGEDFELLLAHAPVPDAVRADLLGLGVVLHEIGTVTAALDVAIRGRDGVVRPLVPRGFDHLAS